jgi:hypothetical protein
MSFFASATPVKGRGPFLASLIRLADPPGVSGNSHFGHLLAINLAPALMAFAVISRIRTWFKEAPR